MPKAIELRVLDDRLHTWGLPRYHSEMAAGIDLFACIDTPMFINAGAPATLVPSGLAMHINDPAIVALIVPRSGLGHKHGLVLGNLVGVIDADYTGPVLISVWNRNAAGSQPITIAPGERIAQMLFVPIVRAQFDLVSEFSATSERGNGGFGSTSAPS